jgi:chorismate synthase
VLAGAVAKQVLAREGIRILGRIIQVYGRTSDFEETMLEAKAKDDSVGGIVEIIADGVPSGLGEPVFDRLDADLAKALMSIGSVKGVEIGAGFGSTLASGSENNDPIIVENGTLRTRTNNAGGILGGISNGMPIICRIAVKPTSSIGIEQDTVDLRTMKPAKLTVKGRHDPCICPRMVPVAEAMVAITILDHLLRSKDSTENPEV